MIKFFVFALSLSMSFSVAFAQTKDLGVSAGLTPRSPFYFFDSFGEWLDLKFTFNPLKKVEKKLSYASERLAELKVLEDVGDVEEADINELLGGYRDLVSEADSEVEDLRAEGADVMEIEKITEEITANHSVFLQEILKTVSKQTEDIVRQTMDFSNQVYEESMRTTREELEKTLEEAGKGVEKELESAREEMRSGIKEGFQEANKSIKEGFDYTSMDEGDTDTDIDLK